MGSCSSSTSNAERRDVINVTVLRPATHAPETAASHVVSKEVQPPEQEEKEEKQNKKNKKNKKDEKERKKERKNGDEADGEKKDKKKDKVDKKKDNKDQKKYQEEDKKDDNTEEMKKEKKKKKKRKDKNDGSKEDNCSSDSSSSSEDEVDHKQANGGEGGAAASKGDVRLSGSGGVDTTVALSSDAVDGEKCNAATDVDATGIAEVSPMAPPMAGQLVIQADAEASVSVEAHIDLNDKSEATRNDASVTITMTGDLGNDGGGGAMSVDIVLSPGGDGKVAINAGSGEGSNQD